MPKYCIYSGTVFLRHSHVATVVMETAQLVLSGVKKLFNVVN